MGRGEGFDVNFVTRSAGFFNFRPLKIANVSRSRFPDEFASRENDYFIVPYTLR